MNLNELRERIEDILREFGPTYAPRVSEAVQAARAGHLWLVTAKDREFQWILTEKTAGEAVATAAFQSYVHSPQGRIENPLAWAAQKGWTVNLLPLDPEPALAVYTIVERPGSRALWLKIGTAERRGDGTLDVRLHALPSSGLLSVRPDVQAGLQTTPDFTAALQPAAPSPSP